MKPVARIAALTIACAACSLPLAIVTGILTAPLWNAFEARTGIESYGHSGPADWVYELLWVLWAAALFGAVLIVRKRSHASVAK